MYQSIHTMYTPHTTHIGHLHVRTVIHDSTRDQYASLHLRISDAKHGHTSRGLARIVATHSRHLYSTHELSYQYTLHNALLTTSTNHTHTRTHTHAHMACPRSTHLAFPLWFFSLAHGRKRNSCKRRRGRGCTCTIRSRGRRGRRAGGGPSCLAVFPRNNPVALR